MSAHVPHARFEELVVGHALSALEPEDEELLLRHLPGCAACSSDLALHRDTLGQLAHVADAGPPPPALWDGIRAEVEASGRPVSFAASSPAPRASGSARVDELQRRRDLRRPALRRNAAWTSVAAAVAVVAGLGLWNLDLQRDRDAQGVLSDRLAQAVQEMEESPARTVPLAAADGRVTAVAVVHADRLSLVVDGLAPNDAASSTYVLWGTSAGMPAQALAAFDVRDDRLDVVHDLPLPMSARAPLEQLLITHEAGRAVPASTSQTPLASGRAA